MAATKQEQYLDNITRNGAIKFVGSESRHDFDLMGKDHFDYLIYHGLKPNHTFFDVGCGALRTGQHIIPYLNSGNYFGLDRMPELIEYGLNEVLTPEIVFEKEPKFRKKVLSKTALNRVCLGALMAAIPAAVLHCTNTICGSERRPAD